MSIWTGKSPELSPSVEDMCLWTNACRQLTCARRLHVLIKVEAVHMVKNYQLYEFKILFSLNTDIYPYVLMMVKDLAYYKIGPSKSMPVRPGPLQCIRNCATCTSKPILNVDSDTEAVIAFKSYEDLNLRQSKWWSPYHIVQYHLGQIDILRRTINEVKPKLVLYIAAVTRPDDCDYIQRVLDHERLPASRRLDVNSCSSLNDLCQGCYILPIHMPSCATSMLSTISDNFFNIRKLNDIISSLLSEHVSIYLRSEKSEVSVVPVAISKDHDKTFPCLRLGTLCIQISEPYCLEEYFRNLKTQHKSGHLIHHLYYDIAIHSPRLASHMVAFLLLFLDRPDGVTRVDLIDQVDWLRKLSMELNLHIAFTGETASAVDFALIVLADYLLVDKREQVYWPKDTIALMAYANIIVPNIAYYGLIGRAILMLHNRSDDNQIQVKFDPNVATKVMKDDVLNVSQELAEQLDTTIACRPPCKDVRTAIVDAFSSMQTFGHFFKVQDALVRQTAGRLWTGDFDSDDEYYKSKLDDPAYKPWIVLTRRPYRLDRLNLFMNAIEPYLSSRPTTCEEEDGVE